MSDPTPADLPPEFGNDEISRQMKRNVEPFEVWWKRNNPLRKIDKGLVRAVYGDRIRAIAESAYNREDLP